MDWFLINYVDTIFIYINFLPYHCFFTPFRILKDDFDIFNFTGVTEIDQKQLYFYRM